MDDLDRQGKRADEHGEYVGKNVKTISGYSLLFGLFGLSFAFLMAGCLAGTGIIAITAFACFAIGSAFGFLFSIPKSAQYSESIKTGGDDSTHGLGDIPRDNTNLEQISDWLVKILIGASLVQLSKVKGLFDALATKLGKCLLMAKHDAMGCYFQKSLAVSDAFYQPFCLFLILYFLTLGFLITRLWLPYVILKTGLAMKSAQRKENELQKNIDNVSFLQDTLTTLRTAIAGLENNSRDDAIIRLATTRSKDCQKLFPTHRTLGILMGRLQRLLKNYDDAIAILNQFVSEWSRLEKVKNADLAAFLFNLACYKNLKAESLDQVNQKEDVEKLRQAAWEDLKKSCQIDPDNKKETDDKDLVSLFNDTTRKKESL